MMNQLEISMINQQMELENEESLKVLREIDTNPRLTQRELSFRLGLSLGKINFLLKSMIERGLVKAENLKIPQIKALTYIC